MEINTYILKLRVPMLLMYINCSPSTKDNTVTHDSHILDVMVIGHVILLCPRLRNLTLAID